MRVCSSKSHFPKNEGSYLVNENEWESKERCNPFLIMSLPVNTLEQWGTMNLIWFVEMKAWKAPEYDLTQGLMLNFQDTDEH